MNSDNPSRQDVPEQRQGRRRFLMTCGGATAVALGAGVMRLPVANASQSPATDRLAKSPRQRYPAIPVHRGGRTLVDKLQQATFASLLHTRFTFKAGESAAVSLELVEVSEARTSGRNKVTESFSIVFRGPNDAMLAQDSYEVEHPELGSFPLFITAIGQDAEGYYYQAIFNRLRA